MRTDLPCCGRLTKFRRLSTSIGLRTAMKKQFPDVTEGEARKPLTWKAAVNTTGDRTNRSRLVHNRVVLANGKACEKGQTEELEPSTRTRNQQLHKSAAKTVGRLNADVNERFEKSVVATSPRPWTGRCVDANDCGRSGQHPDPVTSCVAAAVKSSSPIVQRVAQPQLRTAASKFTCYGRPAKPPIPTSVRKLEVSTATTATTATTTKHHPSLPAFAEHSGTVRERHDYRLNNESIIMS